MEQSWRFSLTKVGVNITLFLIDAEFRLDNIDTSKLVRGELAKEGA